MIPEIITTYEVFESYITTMGVVPLFWIIEYNPKEFNVTNYQDPLYISSPNRYSIMRNECLKNPLEFKNRLNNGTYRIWTKTPYEKPWQ